MSRPEPTRGVADLRTRLDHGEAPRQGPPRSKQEPELPLLQPDERPQDPWLDGRDMRFKGFRIATLEQGGEYPDTMPQAIEVTDADGRKALYVPLSHDGRVVHSAPLLELLKHEGND